MDEQADRSRRWRTFRGQVVRLLIEDVAMKFVGTAPLYVPKLSLSYNNSFRVALMKPYEEKNPVSRQFVLVECSLPQGASAKDLIEHLSTVQYDDYCTLVSQALPDVERRFYASRATHFNINATASTLRDRPGLWDRRPGQVIESMRNYETQARDSNVPITPEPPGEHHVPTTSDSRLPATPKSSVMRVLSPSQMTKPSELTNSELARVLAVQ